ncbi:hypothetical protein LCGC14_1226970 [marine sediment metagenome]|uniref:Uncharacterized protein n=1 Tax=marine sediment metagenome TaxID=412755 RepID=A0A0F9NRV7_9ZZZZ
MSTEYSISVDWSDESNFGKWQNIGQETMREFYEENPKEAIKDGHDVENGEVTYLDDVLARWDPMMNYAYPLVCDPTIFDDGKERIIKVCRDTCLTVMFNDDEDSYYLALCGGGMDLSQSIALAYQILESWLPLSLLGAVSKQPELAVHGKAWLGMAEQIRRQMRMEIARLRDANRQWGTNIREYKITKAKRKANKPA